MFNFVSGCDCDLWDGISTGEDRKKYRRVPVSFCFKKRPDHEGSRYPISGKSSLVTCQVKHLLLNTGINKNTHDLFYVYCLCLSTSIVIKIFIYLFCTHNFDFFFTSSYYLYQINYLFYYSTIAWSSEFWVMTSWSGSTKFDTFCLNVVLRHNHKTSLLKDVFSVESFYRSD